MKKVNINFLANEYIKESEYVREMGNKLSDKEYNLKMEYINECRKELFNRGIKSWGDIKKLNKNH